MRKIQWLLLGAGAMSVALAVPVSAQQVTYKKVLGFIQKSDTDHRLDIKEVDLVLDDEVGRLIVKSKDRPLDVPYDAVSKIILEPSVEFTAGALDFVLGAPTGVGEGRDSDYWCYLEFKTGDRSLAPYLLKIDRGEAVAAIARLESTFGEAVMTPMFPEDATARDIDKDRLADVASEHDFKTDKDAHPTPEVRADQALVVVVEPKPRGGGYGKGRQVKLHANDRVEAVDRFGTYSFFYLEPGDYQLVSQSSNAFGLDISVEAGQAYYFVQYASMGGFRTNTVLLRHSRELVMYLLAGAYHSVWSRKQ